MQSTQSTVKNVQCLFSIILLMTKYHCAIMFLIFSRSLIGELLRTLLNQTYTVPKLKLFTDDILMSLLHTFVLTVRHLFVSIKFQRDVISNQYKRSPVFHLIKLVRFSHIFYGFVHGLPQRYSCPKGVLPWNHAEALVPLFVCVLWKHVAFLSFCPFLTTDEMCAPGTRL